MKEFDDRENFEITFFTFVHRGGIDNGMSFFYVIAFIRRERGVNNILSEIAESLVVVMRDGDIGMNGEAVMMPGSHFINECLRYTLIIFEHSNHFFAEDIVSFGGIDMRERMEVIGGVKDAISDEAVYVGMPGEEITEGLNREDEAWSKRFMREDGAKKFIDSFGSTLSQENEQRSVTIEEFAQNFRDSKDPVLMGDIMQDIVFNPV